MGRRCSGLPSCGFLARNRCYRSATATIGCAAETVRIEAAAPGTVAMTLPSTRIATAARRMMLFTADSPLFTEAIVRAGLLKGGFRFTPKGTPFTRRGQQVLAEWAYWVRFRQA